jgi:hypothetical protein
VVALEHALSDNLHSLQDSFQSNPFLHRMSDSVHSVQHALSDNLHSIQGQLQSVSGSLQHAGHAFQHGLHAVESKMQSSAAHLGSNLAGKALGLQQALREQLRPIVQWPTPRWPVSQVFERNGCFGLAGAGWGWGGVGVAWWWRYPVGVLTQLWRWADE